jgi:glycyl-tRNA synthetase (class II)
MTAEAPHAANPPKSMDEIMSLCKRRGFVYPASEIYGGINGFWDYGPLGAQLKKNLRDAWWQDVVMNPCWGRSGPDGNPVEIVPVDTTIIQNPRVWEASGHLAGFADPMRKCGGCGHFVRADHLWSILKENSEWLASLLQEVDPATGQIDTGALLGWARKKGKKLAPNLALVRNPEVTLSWLATRINGQPAVPVHFEEFVRHVAT